MGIRYIWGKYTWAYRYYLSNTKFDGEDPGYWLNSSLSGSRDVLIGMDDLPSVNSSTGVITYTPPSSGAHCIGSSAYSIDTNDYPYVLYATKTGDTWTGYSNPSIGSLTSTLKDTIKTKLVDNGDDDRYILFRRGYTNTHWAFNAPLSDSYNLNLKCYGSKTSEFYGFYVYEMETTESPAKFQNWVSDARASAYPNYGVSGSYYYIAETQDNIDPTKVTIPDFISFGDTITITVTPSEDAVASSYGSISYRYEYSTNNGGSWQLINTTTSTTQQFTVPEDATRLKVRVRSSDNIGYTSADYVESELVAVTPRGDLGISGEDSDLGVVKSGFTFMVTSETVSEADVTIATAGHEWSFKAAIGTSYNVDIFDLVTGTNSITITASAQVVNGTISATRTHQYTKLEQTFDPGDTVLISNEGVPFYSLQVAEGIKCSDGKMLDVELGDILSRLKAIESQRKAG